MTKRIAALMLVVCVVSCAPREPFDFSRTVRVDYVHAGGSVAETMALERVSSDGPWAGSRTQLLADLELGAYKFEVIDRATRERLYSRGFGSIYSEWLTTPEARTASRTFHESARFPWPLRAVTLVFQKRDAQNAFQPLWSVEIDPSRASSSEQSASAGVETLIENGAAATKVDVLLVGAGYGEDERPRFQADAKRLTGSLFAQEPFKNRKSSFNVRTLNLPGRLTVERDVFGISRYMLASDNGALRDIARLAPYDVVSILVDDNQYGGGGIFNSQSTVAAASAAAEYIFIHEFAHNLAGLGDEYVGTVTYESSRMASGEPWEPNLTALLDPPHLKWRDLVEPGTPLPTPLSSAGKVGAFEGGGYRSKGIYRPEADCIMHSTNPVGFCRVCRRAIERAVDTYTR